MPVSRALRRLLRIRNLEEEQARLELETALGDRHRLEQALASASDRARGGRGLVTASARSGELPDRLAGMEETRAGGRLAAALGPRLTAADEEVLTLRAQYLAARVGRRQAGTLIEEAEAEAALDRDRRSQQGLDDWFGNRMHRAAQQADPGPAPNLEDGDRSVGKPDRSGPSAAIEKP